MTRIYFVETHYTLMTEAQSLKILCITSYQTRDRYEVAELCPGHDSVRYQNVMIVFTARAQLHQTLAPRHPKLIEPFCNFVLSEHFCFYKTLGEKYTALKGCEYSNLKVGFYVKSFNNHLPRCGDSYNDNHNEKSSNKSL